MNNNVPQPKKIPKELNVHGHKRLDNYYWLNDRNNSEVIEHLKAENTYTREALKNTEELQEQLFNEIKGRFKQQDISAPFYENGYFFYYRYQKNVEYPVLCRKFAEGDGEEEQILDIAELAKDYSYYHISDLVISPDNNILAYAEDTTGRRLYTIKFKDLNTHELINTDITNTSGNIVWSNNNFYVFYVKKDQETLRENEVYCHRLGTDLSEDVLIFKEEDPSFILDIEKSKTWQYIFINCISTLSTEVLLIDADNPLSEVKSFLPREKDHEYEIAHHRNKFFIRTNWKAKNFRLMEVKERKSHDKSTWKEVVSESKEKLLENFEAFENYIACEERYEGIPIIKIIELQSKNSFYIPFDEPVYTAFIGYNTTFNIHNLRFCYTSLTTPFSVYYYDMINGGKKLLKEEEIQGGFDAENYRSERVYATGRDGVQIPVSLVYKKDIYKDGSNPLIQYGYGSYGISEEAVFSHARLSLLERGFIYAICHVRGGEERGRWWYENGKFLKKKNTFYDFIDCTYFLINNGYTNPENLVAMGGSAGGMLMGVIANMAPQLYKGIIADVPFVDVLTTMLDESIPLTTEEFDEWGNPKDKTYYDYILSYSPYDNIKEQDYPNILVLSGLNDSQVQYWEPAKWVAKLRDHKTDNNYLLLYTDMNSGHGGASGRFEKYREVAMKYAFIFKILGIDSDIKT